MVTGCLSCNSGIDTSPLAQSSVCVQPRNARKTRTPWLRCHPYHHCPCRHQALHRPNVRLLPFSPRIELKPTCLCLVFARLYAGLHWPRCRTRTFVVSGQPRIYAIVRPMTDVVWGVACGRAATQLSRVRYAFLTSFPIPTFGVSPCGASYCWQVNTCLILPS